MKRLHYAWAVCLGCALMLFVGGGLSVNAFSVTQPYILAYGGFTNTQTSLITTVRAVSYLLCMFASPLFFRKFGYRAGTALATAFSGISFVIYGCSRSLAGFYLGGAFGGLGYGFGSMIPATILMTRWFRRQRGLAIGICSASTGLAMVTFSPVLTSICETFGLQTCFFFEAVFSFLCAALVFVLVRERPEDLALSPCGAGCTCGHGAGAASEKTAPAAAGAAAPLLRRGERLWLFLAAVLMGAIASPGPAHLMILYMTAGIQAHAAALAVSLFGAMLMLGKCLYGAACDRFGGYRMDWLFGAVLFLGLGLCAMADTGSAALMFAGTALYGAGVSLSTVGLSIWAGDFGGEEQAAQLVQRFQLCYGIGGLGLSTMPGMFADWTGSYAPAYLVLLGCAVVSVLIVQATYLKLKKR